MATRPLFLSARSGWGFSSRKSLTARMQLRLNHPRRMLLSEWRRSQPSAEHSCNAGSDRRFPLYLEILRSLRSEVRSRRKEEDSPVYNPPISCCLAKIFTTEATENTEAKRKTEKISLGLISVCSVFSVVAATPGALRSSNDCDGKDLQGCRKRGALLGRNRKTNHQTLSQQVRWGLRARR